ncbi:YitT family protein [Treponema sp. OMZ 840]|uniref:YitT family protein n=1 Tax=Treponema sp. OMZ 840 TaxID=244313 RepID=UPI003D9363F9
MIKVFTASTIGTKIKRLLLITLAAALSAVNIKTFVRAGGLLPGGFTGLTLLIQECFLQFAGIEIPFSFVYFLFNCIPVIISFRFIGRRYTLYSVLMIVLSGLLIDFLPGYPITDDILLLAVFGGGINGVASSLCLLAGASGGGTDFIAIFISEKYGRDAWNYILAGNIVILAVGGWLFGWEKALYSILFQFTTTQVLNYLYRRYQKITLFVITNHTEAVFEVIKVNTNHGATVFHGHGCYNNAERDLVYSVVSGDEVRRVIPKIKQVDPAAFINVVRSKQVSGRFYLRPND